MRIRLALLLVALLAAVQVTAFVLVNRASYNAARTKINEELDVGQRVFEDVLEQHNNAQHEAVTLLASDYAFRRAIAVNDRDALTQRLQEDATRIRAALMQFIDADGNVIADSLHPGNPPRPLGRPEVLALAAAQGSVSSVDSIGGHVVQFDMVAVHSPHLIGYVVAGFELDRGLAQQLRRLTGLDTSFGYESHGQWSLTTSSLSASQLQETLAFPSYDVALHSATVSSGSQVYQLRVIPLDRRDDRNIVAVLQRPINDALASFRALRSTLVLLGVTSLLVSLVGILIIALGITRPLAALLEAVRRIRRGDYSVQIEVHRRDEIGALARGLDHMRQRIAEREQRIMKLAYEDPLTQLPNRSQFALRLGQSITDVKASGGTLAIFVMDLDRFKYVNDSLGHGVGDYVLREVAMRLRAQLTDTDCIARLGGDEFALLIGGREPAAVIELAEHILEALEHPIIYDEQPLDIGASIGVAFFSALAADAETLVRDADIAMYVAKRNKSGFAVYDPRYDTTQQEHLSLLGELRRAIEHGELMLHYQPQIKLGPNNETVVGAEALIRWNHPTRGVVPPDQFIPFAEQTGYIKVLTRWILQEAISQCSRWRDQGMTVQVSINLSARDLMSRELPEMVAALLSEHGLPASLLCLELTESGYMDDPAHSLRVLERLAAIGVRLSIDDYGTGYSSLSYLMKLPVDELKVDRSFVMRLAEDGDLIAIVRSTIELARSLNLEVVAEGVENGRSLALLRSMGCDRAQGYFIARPMPATSFESWMRDTLSRQDAAQDSGELAVAG